ncbi:conserved phage C-terminal domain-containing protein [Bacillus sp. BRMEA1]|uniref:conserved phage C-terminal domain-containing protein n=1 Tax=Neobacillus endophyticus TaxID=2738405 RepID=UPI001564B36C|nr:conserved phage C-terminal domain-containing protein [Neobacillus endophyticus]NRD79797.1 conserved phage C-terminal domain-containing protein [Neobacillus endophyticus]
MSRLLIKENPVMIVPSLAVKIGLNEAVVLQQIHYWLGISKHQFQGRKWVYNTYQDWQKQLPFWSVSTIKRTILSLERQKFLVSGNWNLLKMDQTKWYTIDYHKLKELEEDQSVVSSDQFESPAGQPEPKISADQAEERSKLALPIPEISSESTSEKIPFVEIIHYLNEKTKSDYKLSTMKTQDLIRARLSEGFTLEDFKKVIDIKTAEWLEDPQMCKYLRPATLFGSKFEAYLNQKSFKKILNEEDFDLND